MVEEKVFESRTGYVNSLQKLVSEGYAPANFASLMRKRIDFLNRIRQEGSANLDNGNIDFHKFFDSTDAIAYYGQRVKIVYDCASLFEGFSDRNLRITPQLYEKLDGIELSREQCEEAKIGEYLNAEEAKNHPIWIALAGEQRELLNDFVNTVFDRISDQFDGYNPSFAAFGEEDLDGLGMRVLLYWLCPDYDSEDFETPLVQPCSLSGIHHWTSMQRGQIQSDAVSKVSLYEGSRLLGVK